MKIILILLEEPENGQKIEQEDMITEDISKLYTSRNSQSTAEPSVKMLWLVFNK